MFYEKQDAEHAYERSIVEEKRGFKNVGFETYSSSTSNK